MAMMQASVTKLDQRQSLEVLQTTLHGALSIITYLRDLFPSKAYTNRWYESRDAVLPFEDYASARMPQTRSNAAEQSTQIPVLQRHKSKRADAFLQWLVSVIDLRTWEVSD